MIVSTSATPQRVHLYQPQVFLARHATPDWSRRDIRYDIPPGPPLTPQGEDEARQLGDYLRAQGVVKLYASPLERTRRTAELAGQIAGAPVLEALELAEWRRDEDEPTVLSRVRDLWQRAGDESREIGPIALVTHGGCVLALLAWLGVGQPEINHYRNQFDHRNPLPPAGVWSTTPHAAQQEAQLAQPRWESRLSFSPAPIQPWLAAVAWV